MQIIIWTIKRSKSIIEKGIQTSKKIMLIKNIEKFFKWLFNVSLATNQTTLVKDNTNKSRDVFNKT